ncbi:MULTISPECIES: hypothetical protein [Sphingomonadales]|uniref:Uncharacterized protein n=2 Tax=Edaphosphingomonas TaxID=3423724 RepID=A0A2T4I699_9SPHN|nr:MULTISPECIES: hypothetical protein [Sphingomonas]AGH48328.1 hypothetical protein G432_03005 [Sphingomonas sp. MM-1]MDX3883513.1 hypothetical protein [Sphingomonas sp.]OHT20800.1 hypothetical protein BHE75_02802 [Sphingomonas haloaromaticamans]PTD26170.1 hypothetical protein CV103_04010 [Sphingomonas fennica]
MSRAINLNASPAEVQAMCDRHHARVTAIESLLSGGTRVVLANGDAAAIITKSFGSKVIKGNVKRVPLALAGQWVA